MSCCSRLTLGYKELYDTEFHENGKFLVHFHTVNAAPGCRSPLPAGMGPAAGPAAALRSGREPAAVRPLWLLCNSPRPALAAALPAVLRAAGTVGVLAVAPGGGSPACWLGASLSR